MAEIETALPAESPAVQSPSTKIVIGALAGNFIEFYDFAVYGLIAIPIAKHFFPASDPVTELLSTLLVFAAAFALRPLGGLFWGFLGDRYSRRTTLSATILVMAGATVVMGLLPSYRTLGVTATILLVFVRMVQGFAAGGELGGALTYVAETVFPGRRGLATAATQAGGIWGTAGASIVIAVISSLMPAAAFSSWGWRIGLLLAAPLALLGLYMRLRLEETPAMAQLRATRDGKKGTAPVALLFREGWRDLLRVCGLNAVHALGGYFCLSFIFIYMNTYLHVPTTASYWMNTIIITVACLIMPLFGMLGDRIGRRPVIFAGTIGWIVLAIPMLLLMGVGNLVVITIAGIVLFLLDALCASAIQCLTPEILPTRFRYTGATLGINIPLMLFGGTAPYLSAWMIKVTGSNIAPAYLIMASAVLALVTLRFTPETKAQPLRQ